MVFGLPTKTKGMGDYSVAEEPVLGCSQEIL